MIQGLTEAGSGARAFGEALKGNGLGGSWSHRVGDYAPERETPDPWLRDRAVKKDVRRRYRPCGGWAYLPAGASGVGRTLGPADGIRMTPLALKGSSPG